MTLLDTTVLEKLATFDTPTICNVIELFDIRPRTEGYMDKRISARFPEMPPMVGYASTATLRTALAPRSGESYARLPEQVARFQEIVGPPVVVMQDLDSPRVAATFGEIMCTTYKAFGAVGLVTNGAARDVEQVRALGFPVFTDGIIPSHGYFHLLDIHLPVQVGGFIVYPNDLIHGDANGVTTIPTEIATDVADVGDAYIAAEQVILQAMREEPGNVNRLREAEAETHLQIEAIRRQVARKT
ncbi:MAG: RraA family protein [Chloroflexi bacterium]|nr:MAG: RraA family protein [Chloroflexota bacterium]